MPERDPRDVLSSATRATSRDDDQRWLGYVPLKVLPGEFLHDETFAERFSARPA